MVLCFRQQSDAAFTNLGDLMNEERWHSLHFNVCASEHLARDTCPSWRNTHRHESAPCLQPSAARMTS